MKITYPVCSKESLNDVKYHKMGIYLLSVWNQCWFWYAGNNGSRFLEMWNTFQITQQPVFNTSKLILKY